MAVGESDQVRVVLGVPKHVPLPVGVCVGVADREAEGLRGDHV